VSQLDGGDADRVGSRYRIAWRSRIPYELEFDFTVRKGVTAVLYEWHVGTSKRWMNLLAPLARPVFEYNHDVVMRWGGEGLARRLGVRLLAAG
jgi:hypothetical protein